MFENIKEDHWHKKLLEIAKEIKIDYGEIKIIYVENAIDIVYTIRERKIKDS